MFDVQRLLTFSTTELGAVHACCNSCDNCYLPIFQLAVTYYKHQIQNQASQTMRMHALGCKLANTTLRGSLPAILRFMEASQISSHTAATLTLPKGTCQQFQLTAGTVFKFKLHTHCVCMPYTKLGCSSCPPPPSLPPKNLAISKAMGLFITPIAHAFTCRFCKRRAI